MANSTPAFDFNLFISYSHASDYGLTGRIDSFLESFHKRVPAHARSRLSPLDVCVDGTDFKLPPGPAGGVVGRDVPNVIVQHLARSRELLVLCSAAARLSPWVNREIDWFVENRGPEAIRLALTEGDDPLAVPEAFFAASLIERGLHRNISYDLRGFRGRGARGWSRVADFDRELVRLAADLNGLAAGEIYPLWLVEERRRMRTRAVAATLAAGLVFAGMGFGVVQRSARQLAQANERTARAETAEKEAARLLAEQKRQVEEERRSTAEADARAQQALRLVSDAFERLYRDPSESLQLAAASKALQASAASERALAAAYRVAIFRHENRRQAQRISGSGPGYLASRWSQGSLTSVMSLDGRYLVVITPRGRDGVTGSDGKPMPGELYLIDNETQRPVQLENCRPDDTTRRVEYVGFDSAVQQVLVTRHYNLMAYSLTGDCLGTVLLECCTKSPIHLVEGYFAGRFLLAADTKGGLWLADPKQGRPITVRSEWARDTVTSVVLSADGARAIVIAESGRAALLTLAAGDKPVELPIAGAGVLAAAFHPLRADTFALTGARGLIQLWRLEAGRPVPTETFSLANVPVASIAFTSDGERLVVIADDLRLSVLEPGHARPVATLNYGMDWTTSRKVPNNHADHQPGAFEPLEEAGDRVSFPDPALAVHRVVSVAGRTWILTVRKPEDYLPQGPAFLVEGGTAVAVPDRDTDVDRIEAFDGFTWLHTSKGVHQVSERGVRLVLPPPTQVVATADVGGTRWLATTRGAWRVQGDSVERFTRSDVQVTSISEVEGKLYFATTSGAFRLDAPDRLLRVTDEATAVRRIVEVQDRLWMLTGTESEPGPALLVRDLWTRPLPSRTGSVNDVVETGGATWLLSDRALYRVDGDSARTIEGIRGVAAVRLLAGQVIAFEKQLLGGTLAFAIRGDRAVRLIPEAGVARTVSADGGVYMSTEVPDGFSSRPGPLYRLEPGAAVRITAPESRISGLRAVEGHLRFQVHQDSRVVTARLQDDRIVELGTEEAGLVPLEAQAMDGSNWLAGDGRACQRSPEGLRCFRTPGHTVVGVRRVGGAWWLLTRRGLLEAGPAYRVLGDAAAPLPDDQAGVVGVETIAGATWLLTQRNGRSGPLVKVN
jgi:hypothetical protein